MSELIIKRDKNLIARITTSYVILGLLYVIILGAIGLFFNVGIIPLAIAATAMGLFQWYTSQNTVIKTMNVKVISEKDNPKLLQMVSNLTKKINIPMPKVGIVPDNAPVAFATGRNQKNSLVAVSDKLMNMLDDDELECVVAHELTHIKNRDSVTMSVAYTLPLMVDYVKKSAGFITHMSWGNNVTTRGRRMGLGEILIRIMLGIVAGLVWIVAWIFGQISMLAVYLISRNREFYADKGAALMTGKPMKLASALEKIERTMMHVPEETKEQTKKISAFFIVGFVFNGITSTHPSNEKRIIALKKIQEELS